MKKNRTITKFQKILIAVALVIFVLPLFVCILLSVRLIQMDEEAKQSKKLILHYQELLGNENKLSVSDNHIDTFSENEDVVTQDTMLTDSLSQNDSSRVKEETTQRVYLTFDDGPSDRTNEILDILKQYNVKATFFVVGKTDEKSIEIYKRIVADGHALGLHSFSHKYDEIYRSEDAFLQDIKKLQDFLFETTEQKVSILRFPGGSSNKVSTLDMKHLILRLDDLGIHYFDWNVSSQDANGKETPTNQLVANVLVNVKKFPDCIVLLHDGVNKQETVSALPSMLDELVATPGLELLPITQETKPIQHISVETVRANFTENETKSD